MSETPLSLLERVRRSNEPAAWDRLVGLYAPLLRSWLRAQLPQEADVEDLVQDVLAVVVAKLPQFRHRGEPGDFRSWLRKIVAFRLKNFWRQRVRVPVANGGAGFEQFLLALEESDSDLAKRWDDEHDRYVAARLLEQIRPEFSTTTWAAFERYVIGGQPPAVVAAELGITTNVVFIARSRILRRLREEADGLIDGEPLGPNTAGQ